MSMSFLTTLLHSYCTNVAWLSLWTRLICLFKWFFLIFLPQCSQLTLSPEEHHNLWFQRLRLLTSLPQTSQLTRGFLSLTRRLFTSFSSTPCTQDVMKLSWCWFSPRSPLSSTYLGWRFTVLVTGAGGWYEARAEIHPSMFRGAGGGRLVAVKRIRQAHVPRCSIRRQIIIITVMLDLIGNRFIHCGTDTLSYM